MEMFSVLAGAVVGIIALAAFTLLFHRVFFRSALADGQYAIVFFVAAPIGALLGAMTGLVVERLSRGRTEAASNVALFGGFLAGVFLFLGLFVFSGTEGPTLMERVGATLFWFGLPLLWSGALFKIGLQLRLGKQ